ncbi:MAG: dihydroorotate dehydrogenase electron transfer subunit [Candidatus Palauibacterales bacterium]|nr:dihydroorotate dehydrogenase electron transfer subunit [Candidatus Palauibacterales bacterium]MDP2482927.1 dihydroorotate dehydrogenase electron transfer subunit [Candidatus Palauibacterales bacterium]
MSVPVRAWARVLDNRPAARDTHWIELDCPAIAGAARPGQFVMLGTGVQDLAAPFLPRPFSIGTRTADGRLGFLLRVFGDGTRRLAEMGPPESMLVLGPLGRPFRMSGDRPLLCLAGGVGLAPFLFAGAQARLEGLELRIVYGERSGESVFDPDLIRRITGVEPDLRTEDGTVGRRGLVLDHLDLQDAPQLLACGPDPMLRACVDLAARRGLPLQVSVEEHMGCGVGTCQGCVVRSADGEWIKSCTEGPVFDAEELSWQT